ncbi:hypothetical protein [Haladaptatus sp. YSMS36]|uniref:hypothetical protein n=1 Tax=Haladaptatus sp. YSMS36 TaxID=3033384 RepID=UPI0023E8CE66|nr:hypothetical protein [Haladaptatus sp. YSMS36]
MSVPDIATISEPWAQVPGASEHARLRWLQRTGCFDLTVEAAWRQGVHVRVPHAHCAQTRYHEPTGTLLLADGGRIITVLHARTQDIVAIQQRRHAAISKVSADE